MYNEPEYIIYRNKSVPGWWIDFLPEEKNPYQATDTLTLEKGYLSNYWHIHSSNKHPNYKGTEACNYVHNMIYKRFGGAFLSGNYWGGGRQGERSYHEPEHIVYKNAYIGEDGKIHIKDAKQYYEDVIKFVQNVLREIAKNHFQSSYCYGDARIFFPYVTDAESERMQREAEERKVKVEAYRIQLEEYVRSDEFVVERFEYEKVKFSACYNWEDGWFNEGFSFKGMKSNVNPDIGELVIMVDVPRLFQGNHNKKNPALATKEKKIPFCFYLRGKEFHHVLAAVPGEKVSDSIKAAIHEVCNQAMEDYNKEHIDILDAGSSILNRDYYPENFFLDNQIGKLKLVYTDDAGKFSWRMRWL